MKDDELRRKMFEHGTMTADRFLKARPCEYADIDGPGCYAIVADPAVGDDGEVTFSDIYVGQSVHVCKRLREHLLGHGNARVAEDLGEGRNVHVCVMRCDEPELDDLEVALIRAFDATSYANELPGGSQGRRGCDNERGERTRWQMSLTVDERRWLDRRSRELGLTRSGYVKLLMREDRARVEREEGRS